MTPILLNALTAILVFILGEITVSRYVFKKLKEKYPRSAGQEPEIKILYFPESKFRGIIERLVLYTALHYQFTTILVVFGAIKLGTRITEEQGERISNSYFKIGNFVSILIAISYAVLYSKLNGKLYELLN